MNTAKIEEFLEFVEEVRRSGDTRLASMAIAVMARVKNAATVQIDLFNLLSHREALQLAESELEGSYGSVDQWKTTLSDAEREVLESYELEVQQAFDNITFIITGGLSGAERPRDSALALSMISRLPRNEPNHVPDQQVDP